MSDSNLTVAVTEAPMSSNLTSKTVQNPVPEA